MILLEERISQFQIYIQANFVSLSLICPLACLMQSKSLKFKFLIDLSKSEIRISLFPIARLNLSLSFIQFSIVIPQTATATFRSRIFWRFALSLNECTMFVSRSLSPFDCEVKIVAANRFSVQLCCSFLEAWSTRHMCGFVLFCFGCDFETRTTWFRPVLARLWLEKFNGEADAKT